jgi:hypothetical protein
MTLSNQYDSVPLPETVVPLDGVEWAKYHLFSRCVEDFNMLDLTEEEVIVQQWMKKMVAHYKARQD